MTWTIYINFVPPSQGGSLLNLSLIDQAVSVEKMFENGGHIYVYSPGQGQTTPWGQIVFINSIIQSMVSFAASFPPLNDFVTVFPIQTYR